MQGKLLELLMTYLQRAWLYTKHAVFSFQVMWYESEIQYVDKRIAKLQRDL